MCSTGRLQDVNTFITVLNTSFVCRVKLTERKPKNQAEGITYLKTHHNYYHKSHEYKVYLKWVCLAAHHCCLLYPWHKRWASKAALNVSQASAGVPDSHLISLRNSHSPPAKGSFTHHFTPKASKYRVNAGSFWNQQDISQRLGRMFIT